MITLRTENCILFLKLALYSPLVDLNVVLFTREVATKVSLYYRCTFVLFKYAENVLAFIMLSKLSLHHDYSLSYFKKLATLYYTSKPSLNFDSSIAL